MNDPYYVLGIDRSASDDEVKKAYRDQCRKYHPDRNPGNQAAEDMFKIVQEAYDQIMKERKNGGANGGYAGGFGGAGNSGSYSYNGYGGQQYQQTVDPHLQAAANYINSRHYSEAINVLMGIQNRDAQWYYLCALANAGLGNNYAAKEMANYAVQMDPSNFMYQQLAASLGNNGFNYQNTQYNNYGMNRGSSDFCFNLCMANLCLNMCCDSGCDCCC